jgi:hypothetical protein
VESDSSIEEERPASGGGEGGAPGERAEPDHEGPASPQERRDVQDVPIGRPVSEEEYRRLKERARAPSESGEGGADEDSNSAEEE